MKRIKAVNKDSRAIAKLVTAIVKKEDQIEKMEDGTLLAMMKEELDGLVRKRERKIRIRCEIVQRTCEELKIAMLEMNLPEVEIETKLAEYKAQMSH